MKYTIRKMRENKELNNLNKINQIFFNLIYILGYQIFLVYLELFSFSSKCIITHPYINNC